ncbi:smad anchor for receptor activation isoform X2 [Lycorma delicatula]
MASRLLPDVTNSVPHNKCITHNNKILDDNNSNSSSFSANGDSRSSNYSCRSDFSNINYNKDCKKDGVKTVLIDTSVNFEESENNYKQTLNEKGKIENIDKTDDDNKPQDDDNYDNLDCNDNKSMHQGLLEVNESDEDLSSKDKCITSNGNNDIIDKNVLKNSHYSKIEKLTTTDICSVDDIKISVEDRDNESEFIPQTKQSQQQQQQQKAEVAVGFTLNDNDELGNDNEEELEKYLEELEKSHNFNDYDGGKKDLEVKQLSDNTCNVNHHSENDKFHTDVIIESNDKCQILNDFGKENLKEISNTLYNINKVLLKDQSEISCIGKNNKAIIESPTSEIKCEVESIGDGNIEESKSESCTKLSKTDDINNSLSSDESITINTENFTLTDDYRQDNSSNIDCEIDDLSDDFNNLKDENITNIIMGNTADKSIRTNDIISTSISNVSANNNSSDRHEDVTNVEQCIGIIESKTVDDSACCPSDDKSGIENSESKQFQSHQQQDIIHDVDARVSRPNYLELPAKITIDPEASNDEVAIPSTSTSPSSAATITSADGIEVSSGNVNSPSLSCDLSSEECQLGKVPPFWVPDSEALTCMQCQQRFTLVKRRHHCRACGQVLCSKCCCMKTKLVFMEGEARVCQPCFSILGKANSSSEGKSPLGRQPNPNNPMEYCSTIPPLQQAAGSLHQPPPSVLVPVGVLKREGRVKSEVAKQVMFSDGIRPGGDLTELDGSGEPRLPFRRPSRLTKRVGTPPGGTVTSCSVGVSRVVTGANGRRPLDPVTQSFIPAGENNDTNTKCLPPVVERVQGETIYSQFESVATNGITLNDEKPIKFAINCNLFVLIKRVMLDCCVNRECWCITSSGLACVGQDEVVLLLECLPEENCPPKDVFLLINMLYLDASKGNTVSELSFSPSFCTNLLGSRDHGGFLYIRPSYQCTGKLILPSPPYLVALLIHKWETPWARLFPIRLVLRLGAEYRYYPCPLLSVRHRQPLYTDIGHTIINILADFRKYSYTLPTVRGLVVHMEDRQTTILLPRNRYDQVIRALNNSNDSVLAFGANLSLAADSHLVCMQSSDDENTYHTQAINIHNKPRRVTGASFVVFNGALKASCGLSGKSSIVEDGLMVQVPGDTMTALRSALRDMRDYTIRCGPHAEETVLLRWTADDTNFNIGVKSCIDGRPLDGVPSMRVHNGTDYSGQYRIIRWTEVFILQCEEVEGSGDPLDISRLSESLARATCVALVPYLDLLAAANLTMIGVRAAIHPDHVGYEAGSNCEKLPPLYMNILDNELVAIVHQAAITCQDTPATLELIFRIMES